MTDTAPALQTVRATPVQAVKSSDPTTDKIIQYHQTAENCANLSIWCAAMAGGELIRKKKELKHGQFTLWIDNFELPGCKKLSMDTAQRYMALAHKLDEKIKEMPKTALMRFLPAIKREQENIEFSLQLLDLPAPGDQLNPDHEYIREIVRHITNDRTLTQLYFDWDIVKKPKALGGAREHPEHTAAERLKMEQESAQVYWNNTFGQLYKFGIKKHTWKLLSRDQITILRDTAKELLRAIEQHLKHAH